jgi:RNA polymerase-binding protein DksA
MADFEKTRAALERRLAGMTARLSKIQGHLHEPGDRDWQERATEIENDEVLERLDEAERREIQEIRTALERIDSGRYGECASCGQPIPEARLEALPYTSRCIGCAD